MGRAVYRPHGCQVVVDQIAEQLRVWGDELDRQVRVGDIQFAQSIRNGYLAVGRKPRLTGELRPDIQLRQIEPGDGALDAPAGVKSIESQRLGQIGNQALQIVATEACVEAHIYPGAVCRVADLPGQRQRSAIARDAGLQIGDARAGDRSKHVASEIDPDVLQRQRFGHAIEHATRGPLRRHRNIQLRVLEYIEDCAGHRRASAGRRKGQAEGRIHPSVRGFFERADAASQRQRYVVEQSVAGDFQRTPVADL